MSKELPYFKFEPSEWIMGNITLCSLEAQGLFINLCSYYWIKGGSICLANAQQRFSKCETLFKQLLDKKIFDVNDDDEISIKFLDEQLEKFATLSVTRSKSGKLRGKANAKQMLSKSKANAHIEEKIREDKRREEKIYIPAFDLWLKYKKERKESYKSEMSSEEAYNHLLKLAENDPERAMLIVKQSIANNWSGLFALKTISKPKELTREELAERSKQYE